MQLNVRTCFLLAVGWGVGACALLPRSSTAPPGRVLIEFQDPEFDGQYLRGRLLIGALGGDLVVPEKVEAHRSVIVDDFLECGTGRRLGLIHLCPVVLTEPDPTRILPEGHWYGADLELEVRGQSQLDEALPECVEIELTYVPPFWPPAKPRPERFSVRVSPPQPASDGGTAVRQDGVADDAGFSSSPDGG